MTLAIESTSILSICFSDGSGTVFVMTMRPIGAFLSRSIAGPGQHAVRRHRPHVGRAVLDEALGRGDDRRRGVDHVVDDDAVAPLDVADDLTGDRDVGHALRARLVDERQVGVEVLGESLGDLDAAGVGRDDHRIDVGVAAQVVEQAPARR